MIDSPRLDLVVARHGLTLVVVLVLVGILAFAATGWVVANPSTEETTRAVGEESIETNVHTSAVVEESGLWEPGTTLEDNPVYVLSATPTLDLEVRTTTPNDATEVRHDVSIRYEAVRDGEAFWDRTDPLTRDEPAVLGGTAVSEASLDVESVLAERESLESEVAGIAAIEVVLVVETSYDTGANDGELIVESPLTIAEGAYWFDDPVPSGEDRHTLWGEATVSDSPNAALVGLLVLLGTGSLAAAWAVSRWSDIDEEAARRAVHERRYAEWISEGSIPMWLGDHHVALDTLEDVVDVAIDTNERVVHDRQRCLFAVVSGDVVYYYTDRGLWEETAWPDIDLDRGGSSTDSPAADVPASAEADVPATTGDGWETYSNPVDSSAGDRSASGADDADESTDADR